MSKSNDNSSAWLFMLILLGASQWCSKHADLHLSTRIPVQSLGQSLLGVAGLVATVFAPVLMIRIARRVYQLLMAVPDPEELQVRYLKRRMKNKPLDKWDLIAKFKSESEVVAELKEAQVVQTAEERYLEIRAARYIEPPPLPEPIASVAMHEKD